MLKKLAKKFLFISIITFIIIIGLFGIWQIGLRLEALGYLFYVREALQRECPSTIVEVTIDGFSGDPFPSWMSPEVACMKEFNGVWTCYC